MNYKNTVTLKNVLDKLDQIYNELFAMNQEWSFYNFILNKNGRRYTFGFYLSDYRLMRNVLYEKVPAVAQHLGLG